MKKVNLIVHFGLITKCPYCGSHLNLADSIYDWNGDFSKPIFSNRKKELKGIITRCVICDRDFEINEVER